MTPDQLTEGRRLLDAATQWEARKIYRIYAGLKFIGTAEHVSCAEAIVKEHNDAIGTLAAALADAREALKEAGATILSAKKYLVPANDQSKVVMSDGVEVTPQKMCDLTVELIRAALAALEPAKEAQP